MSIPVLTDNTFQKLLKKAVKRNFDFREYITSAETWWDIYNLSAAVGLVRDDRFIGIDNIDIAKQERRWRSPRKLVLKNMFSPATIYDLSRGKIQSLSYRSNRLEENLAKFVDHEITPYTSRWHHQRTWLAPKYNIPSIWKVRIDRCDVGITFALDHPTALQKAKMFILPMVQTLNSQDSPDRPEIEVLHVCHSTPDNSMADYIKVSAKISETIKENNGTLNNRIKELKSQIEKNILIISSIRDNMMVELEVNQ